MIGAIVLAAGESRRMGRQKLLLPFAGKPVIAHIVEQVASSCVDAIVVVTGHQRGEIESALAAYDVTFAHNANYSDGMLSSIRRGLRELPTAAAAFLVVLGDQPSITPELINALVSAWKTGVHGIVVPAFGAQSGHPIVVSGKYRDTVMTQFDQTGLRGLLYARQEDVFRYPATSGAVLRDMDTPAAYVREILAALENET